MQACRYALEVVAKHPIYLLVYVGFLSLMGLFITAACTRRRQVRAMSRPRCPSR